MILTLRWRTSGSNDRDEKIAVVEPVVVPAVVPGPRDVWEEFTRPDGHRGFRQRVEADLALWAAVNPLSAALAARADLVLLVPPKPGFPDGLWGWVARTDGAVLVDVRGGEGSEQRSVSMGTPSATQTSSATSHTFSYTVASGDNRLLLVLAGHVGDETQHTTTYNGVNLVKHASTRSDGTSTRPCGEVFYLVAPPVGAHDVVSSHSGSSTGSRRRVLGAVSAYGVDQSTPMRAAVSDDGAGGSQTSASVSATSDVGDRVVDVCGVSHTNTGSHGYGADQTQLWLGAATSISASMSHKAGEATSTTMSRTFASATSSVLVAAAIKQAAAPPAQGRAMILSGVAAGAARILGGG